jgi:hypothetical protein
MVSIKVKKTTIKKKRRPKSLRRSKSPRRAPRSNSKNSKKISALKISSLTKQLKKQVESKKGGYSTLRTIISLLVQAGMMVALQPHILVFGNTQSELLFVLQTLVVEISVYKGFGYLTKKIVDAANKLIDFISQY